jgi:hypothetical protein
LLLYQLSTDNMEFKLLVTIFGIAALFMCIVGAVTTAEKSVGIQRRFFSYVFATFFIIVFIMWLLKRILIYFNVINI